MYVYITTSECCMTIMGMDKAIEHIKYLIQHDIPYTVRCEVGDGCMLPVWCDDHESHYWEME